MKYITQMDEHGSCMKLTTKMYVIGHMGEIIPMDEL